jgi:hypothetical protein
VSATCSRGREGRWSWRLTRESGVRPSVGCARHSGDVAEDIRGAYVVMELELDDGCEGSQWRSFVGLLDRQEVGTVVAITEAFRMAEEGLSVCAGGDVKGVFWRLFACLWRALLDGWFSNSACFCSAGAMFMDGSMCESCAGADSGQCRFVVQDYFTGVFPVGRHQFWKGVTDSVSMFNKWRQASWHEVHGGEYELCGACNHDAGVLGDVE